MGGSTNKTSLGLNQWILADKPTMNDFNEDNRIIDRELNDRVPNRLFSPARVINNVPIAELQDVINSLPKCLDRNITINVLAGTTGAISATHFSGPGSLSIVGQNNTHSTTHSIQRLTIRSNSNSYIRINGFNITVTNDAGVNVDTTSAQVHLQFLRIIGVSAGTLNNIGILAGHTPYCRINDCLISNKLAAMQINHGTRSVISGMSGSINDIAFNLAGGSILQFINAGSISGNIRHRIQTGSIVVNPSGQEIGT